MELMSNSIKFNDHSSSPSKSKSKKISKSDTFPCYGCATDGMLVKDCDICNHTGYLDGSNPMVRLIEKIIDLKI
jgi:hypothetical protein